MNKLLLLQYIILASIGKVALLIKLKLISTYVKGMLLYKNVNIDVDSVIINGFPHLFIKSKDVNIGVNFRINSYPCGIGNGNGSKVCVTKGAKLHIGDNSGVSNIVLHCHKEIIIGNHCNIGDGCMIIDTDFHSLNWRDKEYGVDVEKQNTSPVHIGNFVFIGARSIILKGVTIGDKSIVGAGSVVSKDIPAGEVWAGNPAKFIKKIQSFD